MSFLLGYLFIILLSVYTVLLWLVSKKLPKEFALASITFLIAGDAVLVGLWYYSLVDIVEVTKHFRLGIAGAFTTASLGRSIYFLLKGYAED